MGGNFIPWLHHLITLQTLTLNDVTSSKWQRLLVSGIVWLHFRTMGGNENVSSFLMSMVQAHGAIFK